MRDNEPLARALIKIHEDHTQNQEAYNQEYASTPHEDVREASYLYDPKYAGISTIQSINGLFATHPPLEERLKALGIELKNTQQDGN
jgi:heat shock protein HtpX